MSIRYHAVFPTDLILPDRLEFVGLHFDNSGYRVLVSDFLNPNGPMYEINFGNSPLAQRSMDEGKYLSVKALLDSDVKGELGPVVIVTKSDFIDWFHETSCGIYKKEEVRHVAILTQNEWVEVLCLELPKISRFTSNFS